MTLLASAATAEPLHETFESQAQQLGLAQHPTWKSLLHLQQDKPQINDRQFLLSWPAFSPEAELRATLALVSREGQIAACRFPARVLWLQSKLPLTGIDTSSCPEIQEFQAKAPFDKLELVFADESVTQPASILGHSFLRISGEREGRSIDHAISFYTHAETMNLPKLLWESLVTGKEGLFSLSPYTQEERKYLEEDQRNLWRYEIRTTPFERALIRNHFFELKHSQLTYFFHRYNCATVLRNILGIGGQLPPSTKLWNTPKDVVKDLHAAGQIQNTEVQLADSWLVTHLTADLPRAAEVHRNFRDSHLASQWSAEGLHSEQLIGLEAYHRWLHHTGKIGIDTYAINTSKLARHRHKEDSLGLHVDDGQNPRLSNGESHWRAELQRTESSEKILLKWTPASHALMQSHHRASAETELVLLSPTMSIDRQRQIRVEAFDIFSMKSLIPWDPLLRSWSSQTFIGYGSLTGHPHDRRTAHASLQFGLTSRRGAIDLFAVTGPGLRTPSAENSSYFMRTDFGGLWRHGDTGKTRLAWTHWASGSNTTWKRELEQSWFLSKTWHAGWRYSDALQRSSRSRSLGVSLIHIF